MKIFLCILILLNLACLILAQPIIIEKKIISINQPLAYVHKIKKINSTEFGAVGETINETGHRDIFFAKFNYDSLIFSKSYHSETSLVAQDFEMTEDSSFIIVGDNAILKISNIGDSIWLKNINTVPNASTLYSIVQVDDTKFVACGYVPVFQPPYLIYYSIWVLKFNVNGEIIWQNFYGGATYYLSDYGIKLIHTSDNNLLMTGTISQMIFLLKTDIDGNEIFLKHYNNFTPFSDPVASFNLSENNDNSYFITGSTSTWSESKNILLIKTENDGDTLFVRNYDGNIPNLFSRDDYGVYVKKLNNNKIILGGNGFTSWDYKPLLVIILADSVGNIIWEHTIENEISSKLMTLDISQEKKLYYLGTENILPNNVFIIKTSYDVTSTLENNTLHTDYKLYQNYPNPFNPTTKIKYSIPQTSYVTIKVYDILGKEIETIVNEEKPIGNYEIEFDGSKLTSGVYFYKMKVGSFINTKKFILIK